MPAELIQFLGSLAAILALAALAWWFELGPEPTLKDESEARHAATQALDGFEPRHVALDEAGKGALLGDDAGRILLLRPHGTHFAGRLLTSRAEATLDGDRLVIDTAERRFGSARLHIADPHAWVRRIDAIQ